MSLVSAIKSCFGEQRVAVLRRAVADWGGLDETAIVFRALCHRPPGVMIDVGAHHGESFERFAVAGWTIHAFEPDPSNLAALARFGHLPNVTVWPAAISDGEPRKATFYTDPENSFLSSLLPSGDRSQLAHEVQVLSLANFRSQSRIENVDFLKIDAEGADLAVLRSWGTDPSLPDVVLCEFDAKKCARGEPLWNETADFLRARGFSVLVSEWEPIQSYSGPFVWCRFFEYPGQLAHPHGNGNMIASRDPETFARLRRFAEQAATRHRISRRIRAACSG